MTLRKDYEASKPDTSERTMERNKTMAAKGKSNGETSNKPADAAVSKRTKRNSKKPDAAVKAKKKTESNSAAIAAGPKKSQRLLEWEDPDKLALIEGWVRNGVIEKDIAHNMHCSYSTLREWKKISPALSAALKKNRDIADYIVEGALFKKASGHKETVRKPMKVKRTEYDAVTGRRIVDYEEIVYVEEEVYIPPDTPADIFWLKNRRPDLWKDKIEHSIDAEIDGEASGVIMIAPVLEKNHEPTEDNMAAATETN